MHVSEGPALRVTRRPERPSLGRKAREARIEDLRREAAGMSDELERRQARLRAVQSALGDLDQLLPDAELLEQGDPGEQQSVLQTEDARLAQDEKALDQTIAELAIKANETRGSAARHRSLLAEAFLLDAEDHAAAAQGLSPRRKAWAIGGIMRKLRQGRRLLPIGVSPPAGATLCWTGSPRLTPWAKTLRRCRGW